MCPTHSYLLSLICINRIHAFIYTIDFLIIVDSALFIFLYWSMYSSKCFSFRGFRGHFHLLGHGPSFACIAYDASDYGFFNIFLF